MKVLIGTPIYTKSKNFLDQFLQSINNQDHAFDLLLSDNSEQDDFFHFLISQNLTVIKSKNKGNKFDNVLASRKDIVQEFLKKDYTHLFWVDSDILLPKNALSTLLSKNKDIVSGVYISPFRYPGLQLTHPVAYKLTHDEGLRLPLQIQELKKSQLMEVHSVGFGCCLIKRNVLEEIPLRRIENTTSTEDILFCFDARKKGYKTFLDTDVFCQHILKREGEMISLGIPNYI